MRRTTRRLPGLALAALIVATTAAPAAPPPLPDDAPAMDRLNAQMRKIRGQLKNASIKMNNKVQGVDAESAGGASVMKSCCGSNLKHIAKAARAIDGLLPELSACYESDANDMAVAAVEIYRNDLREFARSMAKLQDTQGDFNAKMVMDATTRAFLNLRESGDRLPACPAAGESPTE